MKKCKYMTTKSGSPLLPIIGRNPKTGGKVHILAACDLENKNVHFYWLCPDRTGRMFRQVHVGGLPLTLIDELFVQRMQTELKIDNPESGDVLCRIEAKALLHLLKVCQSHIK
ncbi:MAG: hypothetical protein ACOYOK_15775 [Pseudobdellovibrionaceae bacterium]